MEIDEKGRMRRLLVAMVLTGCLNQAPYNTGPQQQQAPGSRYQSYTGEPDPPRSRVRFDVTEDRAAEGFTIAAAQSDGVLTKITIANDTDDPASVIWDESSFVAREGESYGRMLRGETKQIDSAKSQPPSPLPPHAKLTQVVVPEKSVENLDVDAMGFALFALIGGKVYVTGRTSKASGRGSATS